MNPDQRAMALLFEYLFWNAHRHPSNTIKLTISMMCVIIEFREPKTNIWYMMERAKCSEGKYTYQIHNCDDLAVLLLKKMKWHRSAVDFWRPTESFIDTTIDLIDNCHEFDWSNMMTRCEMLVFYASDLFGIKSHHTIVEAEKKMRQFLTNLWGSQTDRLPQRVAA